MRRYCRMDWWEADHVQPGWYVEALLERARAELHAGVLEGGDLATPEGSSAPDTLAEWR